MERRPAINAFRFYSNWVVKRPRQSGRPERHPQYAHGGGTAKEHTDGPSCAYVINLRGGWRAGRRGEGVLGMRV